MAATRSTSSCARSTRLPLRQRWRCGDDHQSSGGDLTSGLTADAREALGIREGTIRVSAGVEEFALLVAEFRRALDAVAAH